MPSCPCCLTKGRLRAGRKEKRNQVESINGNGSSPGMGESNIESLRLLLHYRIGAGTNSLDGDDVPSTNAVAR